MPYVPRQPKQSAFFSLTLVLMLSTLILLLANAAIFVILPWFGVLVFAPSFPFLVLGALLIALTMSIALGRWLYLTLRWEPDSPLAAGCASCGYNLTGNVSGRCPECGNRIIPQETTVTEDG